jgi:hypothetical protein
VLTDEITRLEFAPVRELRTRRFRKGDALEVESVFAIHYQLSAMH